MKTAYIVSTYGYSHCPETSSLTEARKILKELVSESLSKARRRGHKQARKHKIDTDCYRITLGPDAQSTMYSHHCIISAR